MTVIIAGERSGVGKTTVTLALLAALRQRGSALVQSFKVGPDYIDPMFHQFVTGLACRNLDPMLTSEAYVRDCWRKHAQNADYAVVEGVMGLFDGVTGKDDWASTAHVARLLELPIVLVLNCSSTARSIAAIAHGYRSFDPRLTLAGVVLNRVGSDRHLELLQDALAPLGLPILGVFRRQDDIAIPDRHLGLVPTGELPQLQAVIDRLAELGKTCFNWEKLLPLLKPNLARSASTPTPVSPSAQMVRLAVARDSAFNFYYADNFDLLKASGFELVEWSPLSDRALPNPCHGLYLGGGFPEIFASALSENLSAKQSVQAAIAAGLPTYAECGGLMYLCEQIVDFEQNTYPMVGVLPTQAQMGKRLTLGYRQATAQQTSLLLEAGEVVWGHEFHRSHLTLNPHQPLFALQNHSGTLQQTEGWQVFQTHASYVHLHFGGKPGLVQRFWQQCRQYQLQLHKLQLRL
jgi:cobyrinic acid a,c-diamide synthase